MVGRPDRPSALIWNLSPALHRTGHRPGNEGLPACHLAKSGFRSLRSNFEFLTFRDFATTPRMGVGHVDSTLNVWEALGFNTNAGSSLGKSHNRPGLPSALNRNRHTPTTERMIGHVAHPSRVPPFSLKRIESFGLTQGTLEGRHYQSNRLSGLWKFSAYSYSTGPWTRQFTHPTNPKWHTAKSGHHTGHRPGDDRLPACRF